MNQVVLSLSKEEAFKLWLSLGAYLNDRGSDETIKRISDSLEKQLEEDILR